MYDGCAVIDGGSASRPSNPFRADLNPDLVPKSADWSGRVLHRTSRTLNLELLTCNTLLRLSWLFLLRAMSSHLIIGDSPDAPHSTEESRLDFIQPPFPTTRPSLELHLEHQTPIGPVQIPQQSTASTLTYSSRHDLTQHSKTITLLSKHKADP